jgi:hypothetical protein
MNLIEACKTDDYDIIYNALNEKYKPTKECYKILINNYNNKRQNLFYDIDGIESPTKIYRWVNRGYILPVEIGFCSYQEMNTKKQITDVPNINLLIQYGYKIDKNDLIEALKCNLHYNKYKEIIVPLTDDEDIEKIRIKNIYNLIKNHDEPSMFKKIINKYTFPIDYNLLLFCCDSPLKQSIISYLIHDCGVVPTLECLIKICNAKYYKLGYDLINNYNIKPTNECLEKSYGRKNIDNTKFCNFLKKKINNA